MKAVKPRDLALAALNSPDNYTGFSDRYLEHTFQKNPDIDLRDRAFTTNMVRGVLRWRLRLDWIIKQFLRFPFGNIEPPILNILRIAVYQIFFMDRIPESAAVNEAAKQAKAQNRKKVVGFVNGVLRQICRQKEHIDFPDRENDQSHYMSVFYSYPEWLVKKWVRELGLDSTEHLLEAGNQIPCLAIRTNTLNTNRADLIAHLERERIGVLPTLYSPEGIQFEGPSGPVNLINVFRKGLFQVQGEAAQICSHILSPRPGDRVLDLCAGLGGKSTHLAELMEEKGWVVALDINRARLVSLKQNSRRLGISSIQPIVADAGGFLSSLFNCYFDKILVDGPCSGLGIISRHPDGKWSRDERDIKRLSLLQIKILNEAAALLRKGGHMLYVTCTISNEENEQVAFRFLENNKQMALVNIRDRIPVWGLELIDKNGFFKTFPHIHGMDGFFGALFTKKYT